MASSDTLRRWMGGICLALSAGMLLAGMTLLEGRLQAEAFIYYWLVCIVLTFLTLIIALLDMRAVRLRARKEQTKMIEEALQHISEERNKTPGRNGEGG